MAAEGPDVRATAIVPKERRNDLTKQERVYAALRERILSGAYGPGYRVVIDALAEEFTISALPVREAIRRLEAEGLVIYRPNAGAQVAPADPRLFDEQLTLWAVLEGYATSLAASEFEPSGIRELIAINNGMSAALSRLDTLGFGRLNREFHAVIHEHCPNKTLVAQLADISRRLDAIRRTVFVQIPYRGAVSIAEHSELIELIKARADPAVVEATARAHKLSTVTSFQAWQASERAEEGASARARERASARRRSRR